MSRPLGKEIDFDIFSGENSQAYPSISNETTYNLFECTMPNSTQRALIQTPGFKLLHEISPGEKWRGIFMSNILDTSLVAIGNAVYSVSLKSYKLLFNIDTLTGKVYFKENARTESPTENNPGGQIALSDGENIYVYQIDGTLTKATDDGGETLGFTPGMLAFQDDTFFCNDLKSNAIRQSTLIDARTWPANKFAFIDNETRGCLCMKTMLFVFGDDETQIFHDAANAQGFTYSKDTLRSFEYGLLNAESIGQGMEFFAWLSESKYGQPVILMSSGGEPNVISDTSVNTILNRMEKPEDSNGFVYKQWGHTFYQINFFHDNVSFLYNFDNKKWCRISDGKYGVHPIQDVLTYRGGNFSIALSSKKGNVYEFGIDIYSNDGEIIPRSVTTQNYVFNGRQQTCNLVEIDVEEGENEHTTQVCLLVSKDRGRVFRPYKRKKYGKLGFRKRLLRFRQLGSSRWWSFKLDIYTQDRVVLMAMRGYFS